MQASSIKIEVRRLISILKQNKICTQSHTFRFLKQVRSIVIDDVIYGEPFVFLIQFLLPCSIRKWKCGHGEMCIRDSYITMVGY